MVRCGANVAWPHAACFKGVSLHRQVDAEIRRLNAEPTDSVDWEASAPLPLSNSHPIPRRPPAHICTCEIQYQSNSSTNWQLAKFTRRVTPEHPPSEYSIERMPELTTGGHHQRAGGTAHCEHPLITRSHVARPKLMIGHVRGPSKLTRFAVSIGFLPELDPEPGPEGPAQARLGD
jgi:hypothetical protein